MYYQRIPQMKQINEHCGTFRRIQEADLPPSPRGVLLGQAAAYSSPHLSLEATARLLSELPGCCEADEGELGNGGFWHASDSPSPQPATKERRFLARRCSSPASSGNTEPRRLSSAQTGAGVIPRQKKGGGILGQAVAGGETPPHHTPFSAYFVWKETAAEWKLTTSSGCNEDACSEDTKGRLSKRLLKRLL